MHTEGPELEALLHRLSECPAEFLQVSTEKDRPAVDVVAIVCDHMRPMTPDEPPERQTFALEAIRNGKPARQGLVSIICWLLHDEWFLARPDLAPDMWNLLISPQLTQRSAMIKPEKFVSDADRREELVRVCLSSLGLRPKGETAAQATDRLTTLDSVERERVLRATAAAEKRAREVRQAMARAQAQEAASRYGECGDCTQMYPEISEAERFPLLTAAG
ncbi:MAG: hypothetical protein HY000_41920, partial [Planctomycetes bacterium]|nr:hypothetical protein [Planctomycetota bacterium]